MKQLLPLAILSAAAFCLPRNALVAAPAIERGRVVLNCDLDDARKITACVVTRETPGDIGLGAAAMRWAIGRTIPGPTDAKAIASPVIDLPLCFNITREPLRAVLDQASKCDAVHDKQVTYTAADIVSKPENVMVYAIQPLTLPRTDPEDLIGTQAATRRDAMAIVNFNAGLPHPPSDAVALRCLVMTAGNLDCIAPTNPNARQRAALESAKFIKVSVKQFDGAPAVGWLNVQISVKTD